MRWGGYVGRCFAELHIVVCGFDRGRYSHCNRNSYSGRYSHGNGYGYGYAHKHGNGYRHRHDYSHGHGNCYADP